MPRRKQHVPTPPPPVSPDKSLIISSAQVISNDVLKELGVDLEQYKDFVTALHFVTLQSERKSIKEIAEILQIDRPTFYEPRWRDLLAAARRFLISQIAIETQGVASYALGKWPEIIESMVNVALHSRYDRDKVAAAEFLRDTFDIMNATNTPDATPEKKYLSELPNFNPAGPLSMINVQPGGTVNVTVVESKAQEKNEPDQERVIDVSASPDDLDFSPRPQA